MKSMTPRERYRSNLLFDNPDQVPLAPGWPRESTLRVWHTQGLPESTDWRSSLCQALSIEESALHTSSELGVDLKMRPVFQEEVLDHRDGHYIVRDWMGAITEISDEYDYTYIRRAKDFVTRKWHRFPVESRADWREKMAWRYDANDPDRFPDDFVFQLSIEEFDNLRSQNVTSSWGGRRYQPRVFTEQGIAMLSSVLRSKRAVEVNIAIMRTFVKLREILAGNAALRRKIQALERKYDEQFKLVFKVLSEMVMPDPEPKTRIGYLTEEKGNKSKQSSRK